MWIVDENKPTQKKEKFVSFEDILNSEIEEFDSLPDGTYKVTIEDFTFGIKEGTEKTRALFTLKVIEGDYSERKEWINLTVKGNTFSEKSMRVVKGFKKAGSPNEDQDARKTSELKKLTQMFEIKSPNDFINKLAKLVIITNEAGFTNKILTPLELF